MGVHASDNESRDSEVENCLLLGLRNEYSRHRSKPVFQNEVNLNKTMILNENPEEENYHNFQKMKSY